MSSARPSVDTTYDLIVVGLGALGSAALFHATEAGLQVLGSERVVFASPCSDHGFKHSTAIAQAMVQRVITGASGLDLQPFGRERFAAAQ